MADLRNRATLFCTLAGLSLFSPAAPAQAGPPAITASQGVVNGASFQTGIASSSWVTIRGTNLSATTRIWTGADFQAGRLPVSLDGVSVKINNRDALVYYISPTQINVLAPADVSSGTVQVVVTNATGASAPVNVQLTPILPAFFRLKDDYITATTPEGGFIAPTGIVDGLVTVPARPLETVVLWGTGFGPTTPAIDPGQAAFAASPLLNPPSIRIGQATAAVVYAGVTSAGLCQFNAVVPDLANGDYPVVAQIAGVRTSSIARLRIQR